MLIEAHTNNPTALPPSTVTNSPANIERTTGFSIPERKAHEFDAIEAGRSASQTSGTSASRTLRRRLLKRRMMVERVEQPLNQTWLMLVPVVLVTMSVAIGFYVSLDLYNDSTRFFNVEFDAARDARGMARRIVESIRLMVSSNLLGDRPEWEAAHNTVSFALTSLMTDSLAALNKHYQALPSVRLSLRRNMNGTMSDFDTVLLTPEVFESIPRLNMITGHMRQVFDLVGALMAAFTDAYRVNLNQNTTMLVVFAIASVAFLVLAMGVTHKFVLSRYFDNESGLYSLLRRVQKRPLSNIVTSLEEEIENFREIGLGDADEDAAELRGMAAGGGRAKSRMGRKAKLSIWMCLYSAVLALLMLLMYSITITSLNQSADLDRLVLSLDRRLYTTLLRVCCTAMRTACACGCPAPFAVSLLNDPTVSPPRFQPSQVCPANAPRRVLFVVPTQPSIGYTLESGMVPLNVAITRMTETASEVIAAFVTTPVVNEDTSAFTNSTSYGKYELLMYQCTDIIPRVEELDQGIQAMMNRRVVVSSSVTISIFVAFLAVEAVGLLVAWVFGLERLRRESRTLTSLPFLLPAAVLSATKELDSFVESGGWRCDGDWTLKVCKDQQTTSCVR
ncbi:hypothetical protein BCR44DRAFT_1423872 [Catenaria anguillulae PL171]|uniref:Uncharacterized protein n=1 Tax=Catenaria anguillulae PL171 TaxID=765915 RepID=A0A1Y2I4C8_9FUNG|nr:hypothetical protein BCR44DRAFT_1423872 [Catenaria anguillulae PL171]